MNTGLSQNTINKHGEGLFKDKNAIRTKSENSNDKDNKNINNDVDDPVKKLTGNKADFETLLAQRKTDDNPGFVTITTEYGKAKVRIPPKKIKYYIEGDACTEKIEEILQPKKRTRYVRGLTENQKKDRRREQNRNAAARSRARKNAMISKVIQLHQENIGLRAYVADNIRIISELKNELNQLKGINKENNDNDGTGQE